MDSKKKFDEAKFQKEIRETEWYKEFQKEYGESPDLDTKDYDYRKAWAAGVRPERYKQDNNKYHWPSSLPDGSMLKSKDHPTAWKEQFMRSFGQNPDDLKLKEKPDFSMLDKPIKGRKLTEALSSVYQRTPDAFTAQVAERLRDFVPDDAVIDVDDDDQILTQAMKYAKSAVYAPVEGTNPSQVWARGLDIDLETAKEKKLGVLDRLIGVAKQFGEDIVSPEYVYTDKE